MATIKIKNLRLRTIIGVYDWEREEKQDVIINTELAYDSLPARAEDRIEAALDYKLITKEIIAAVEASQFFLLEKLADHILQLIMSHSEVVAATVEVDKPGALRFADSVSVTLSAKRK